MAENEKNTKSDAALREEKVLEFWRENKIFEKSLEKDSPKGNYVFYDGPPFATGLMHYGHILGSTAKDVVGRYQTMRGFHVPRKWGWDCHGLPIENIVEKDLGIAGHNEIESLGIDKFVEHARSKVLTYDKEWKKSVERIGRWVDFEGGYKTMDNTFIESVWWALSELNKKDLIYEGVRVLAYCARCETPIANSEIAMDNSYKDIADISVYTKFELVDEPDTYLLTWTTTPWTLPGNTAIAVNKDIDYVKVKVGEELVVLAKDLLAKVLKDKVYEVVQEFKGEVLVGKRYKPVFPYYEKVEMPNKENIWKVWHADFVTTELGTGLAHEAPAFGEDDMNLAKRHNIPWIIHVDETGRFKKEVVDFPNLKVKPKDTLEDKDAHLRTDIEVVKYLQKTGAYFDKEKITHSYPHCMRCDTPIIYYALPSWFINIQKVKPQIVEQAKKMTWIPAHLKDGRFKNIVENAPDWNISRNRYWASPLPIWKCVKCGKKTFISSLEELKSQSKKSGNKYFLMRHGESEKNVKGITTCKPYDGIKLTEKGKKDTEVSVSKLKNSGITHIVTSEFLRAQETAEIACKTLGLPSTAIIVDKRLNEYNAGIFDKQPDKKWFDYLNDRKMEIFDVPPENGESFNDLRKRTGEFIYEIEHNHSNTNFLIISHGGTLCMIAANTEGADKKRAFFIDLNEELIPGEVRLLPFVPLPHNSDYELDLHRPYIDKIELVCDCGEEVVRIPEVLDCWFESGSMPFAQDHYPFENPKWQKNNFPADFVAEYIAQTRTWFYYTHIVSTLVFDKAPLRNVVTTGNLLAEDGQKMSKSKGNFTDPWILFDKYGVDALRLHLMSSPLMKGEDANFSEKSVQEVASKVFGRLYNVLAFYELYKEESLESTERPKSKDMLDQWMLLRLEDTIKGVTKGMEAYDMAEATRFFDPLVDDLSTWYLRRSRERIKGGDPDAKQTLYFVLRNLATLLSPFAPFSAEDIYLKLKHADDPESVHLCEWPKVNNGSLFMRIFGKKVDFLNMQEVRKVVSLGLQARQKAGIPVRQPLSSIKISTYINPEYMGLIKDELNIKEVIVAKNADIILDTNITEELKQEGIYRELLRAVQGMRKKMGLTPSDVIAISFETSDEGKEIIQKFEPDIKKVATASSLEFRVNDGEEIKLGELIFKIKIEK
jgi:isoleucyl-tRNA synthetase